MDLRVTGVNLFCLGRLEGKNLLAMIVLITLGTGMVFGYYLSNLPAKNEIPNFLGIK